MFSRYLVIVLSFAVAIFQATRGNWVEVAGLLGLACGLILLLLSAPQPEHAQVPRPPRPTLRWLAWSCFLVTVAAMLYVYRRDY